MILSTGEEEKFKKARYTMIYAFVWLLVAGLAYWVVNFITNVNFTNIIR
jgi:lipopolysaccharide export LptBFGC system permease protein LptF